MIGLLDISGGGLVRAALDAGGHKLARLSDPEEAMHGISDGSLNALVIETERADARLFDLLSTSRLRSIPVLVVARDRSVSAAVEVLRAGATDYLGAPFEFESLSRAVDRLMDESCVSPRTAPTSVPFVTQDPDVRAMLKLLRSIAASDATILIEGDSGTGKELLARMVHEFSPRASRELISINCAALPDGLLESELFGHERGAFTGAHSRVIGKFELAHGTTILLDEIGELELALQAKLLRVIQEKQVQRLGARRPVLVDFRLVTTTNRELAAEVRAGRFREDLFYRVNVLPIHIKPLCDHADDIPLLIEHFLRRHATEGRRTPCLADEALEALRAHAWPGNVRELENLIERLVLTFGKGLVTAADLMLPGHATSGAVEELEEPPPFATIRGMERWLIVKTLTLRVGNRTQTARDLGISLRTLRNKINEYRINEPETLPRTGIGSYTRGVGNPRPGISERAEVAR